MVDVVRSASIRSMSVQTKQQGDILDGHHYHEDMSASQSIEPI
jgi:hypothetical protein